MSRNLRNTIFNAEAFCVVFRRLHVTSLLPEDDITSYWVSVVEYIIFAHGDSDGVASAALIYRYLRDKGAFPKVVFSHPAGLLGDLREFAQSSSNVFIVDIALNEVHKEEIFALLEKLSKRGEVVYIDHHPLLDGLLASYSFEWVHDTCCSASELTYRYLSKKGLPDEYSRVALYGAIGDYMDETDWVREALWQWDKRSIYLESGILTQGLEGSRREHDFKRRVVEHLAENKLPSAMNELVERSIYQASQDEKLRVWVREHVVKQGAIAYVLNPPGSVGRAANYARVYGGAIVGLAAEDRGTTYVMSLRAVRGVDLNYLLRSLAKKMRVNGGGHPQAAGARVDKAMFEEFLKMLSQMLCDQVSSRQPGFPERS